MPRTKPSYDPLGPHGLEASLCERLTDRLPGSDGVPGSQFFHDILQVFFFNCFLMAFLVLFEQPCRNNRRAPAQMVIQRCRSPSPRAQDISKSGNEDAGRHSWSHHWTSRSNQRCRPAPLGSSGKTWKKPLREALR